MGCVVKGGSGAGVGVESVSKGNQSPISGVRLSWSQRLCNWSTNALVVECDSQNWVQELICRLLSRSVVSLEYPEASESAESCL